MNYVAGLYAGCMYIVSLKIVISYKNQNKIPIQITFLPKKIPGNNGKFLNPKKSLDNYHHFESTVTPGVEPCMKPTRTFLKIKWSLLFWVLLISLIIILLFIQNISPFLIDSNHTHNSSWPVTVDQIWKNFVIDIEQMTKVQQSCRLLNH